MMKVIFDNDSTDYGIAARHNDVLDNNAYITLYSGDYTDTLAYCPQIEINYAGPPEPALGDIITSAQGSVINRARGYELEADRNKGKVINSVRRGRK